MIYIFDILGIHCGMHYYDLAFAELFQKHEKACKVLSNFKESTIAYKFFPLFFSVGKLPALLLFLFAYCKFPLFIIKHRREKIVYLTYGELYEIPFLLSLSLAKDAYVDVHEVHALKYKDDSMVSKLFEWIYRKAIRKVIYHSDRTKEILSSYDIKMIYVPHFRYVFKKTYDDRLLGDDIKDSFCAEGKKRFLFFGNLSVVKGIDIVTEVFSQLKCDGLFELVIAGKNVDNQDFSALKSSDIHVVDRHINDDELVYLYSHTDYVLLPYKKTSQSGIFAMSAYFHKPMIMSDIPYFKEMITDFPSFGFICPIKKYAECIETIIKSDKDDFYKIEDCCRFDLKDEMEFFVEEICQKK